MKAPIVCFCSLFPFPEALCDVSLESPKKDITFLARSPDLGLKDGCDGLYNVPTFFILVCGVSKLSLLSFTAGVL